jgi:hypothetical protein
VLLWTRDACVALRRVSCAMWSIFFILFDVGKRVKYIVSFRKRKNDLARKSHSVDVAIGAGIGGSH